MEFTDHAIGETREVGENVYVDRDRDANRASITAEPARPAGRPQVVSSEEGAGRAGRVRRVGAGAAGGSAEMARPAASPSGRKKRDTGKRAAQVCCPAP